jgi:ankyrin repeat protein
LNQQNEDGNTVLHLACIGDKTKTVEELIKAGVDATTKNNQGKQAKDLTENSDLKLKSLLSKATKRLLPKPIIFPNNSASLLNPINSHKPN